MDGPAKNALSTVAMAALLKRITAAAGQPLLLTGTGNAFSAGLDLHEVAALDTKGMAEFLLLLEQLFTTLYQYPGPTAAWINGHAIAGGCVLALCCDVRIASAHDGIKIGLNEAALGVPFPPRTMAIVRARIPRQHQDEVLLGGGLFNPERARQLGLIDAVATTEEMARQRLALLASHPREAFTMIKRDLRGANPNALASTEQIEQYLSAAVPIWTGAALRTRVAGILGARR